MLLPLFVGLSKKCANKHNKVQSRFHQHQCFRLVVCCIESCNLTKRFINTGCVYFLCQRKTLCALVTLSLCMYASYKSYNSKHWFKHWSPFLCYHWTSLLSLFTVKIWQLVYLHTAAESVYEVAVTKTLKCLFRLVIVKNLKHFPFRSRMRKLMT